MAPYDPRGRGKDGGEGKQHRAVLLGVADYKHHLPPLNSVTRSVQLMKEALSAEGTGVLERGDIIVPKGPLRASAFHDAVSDARDKAKGLLLVYFAGHGLVRRDGSDLHLMVSGSWVAPHDEHPFVDAISWRHDVMGSLIHAKAERVVVILDCCYAGNALRDFAPVGQRNFAVLTAAEAGVEIPAGTEQDGTPFTQALHRLLTTGIPGQDQVTFTGLVAAVQKAMASDRAVDGHRWLPDERRCGDDVILSYAPAKPVTNPAPAPTASTPTLTAPAPTASTPTPAPTPTPTTSGLPPKTPPDTPPVTPPTKSPRPGRWPWRWIWDQVRKRIVTRDAAVVLAMALVIAGDIHTFSSGSGAVCATPTQLRLLADPDVYPTVQKAADAYVKRDPAHCRTVGITVYQAKATGVVTAFQNSAVWQSPPAACPRTGDCLRPQRDIGAQPDIWIPGASSTWRRALGSGQSAVTLQRVGPLAFSPLVLAVPESVSLPAADQTGAPLSQIIAHLRAPQSQAALLRPDPEYTDAALLGTTALYASLGGAGQSPEQIEQGITRSLSPVPATARELMCALALGANNALEDRAAVLVPEQTMAQFNLDSGDPGRPWCAGSTLARRIAQYPADVDTPDLPFIHVTWKGADRQADRRNEDVRDFYDWLTGPAGQEVFTGDGYRGVRDGAPAAPAAGSPLTRPVNARAVRTDLMPPASPVATPAVLRDALQHYRQALGPGRVLYLLDSSSSMDRVWDGPGRAKDLLTRSLATLGAKDEYALWSVVGNSAGRHHDLLGFGSHDRKAAQDAVDAAATVPQDADPVGALRAALAALRERTAIGGERPQLIVLITDDEDSADIAPAALKSLAQDVASGPKTRVVTVSLHTGGCASVPLDQQITAATGGRCLDPAVEIATELTAEVAKTGTGDAE